MLSLLADLSHYLQLKQSRQDYYFSFCSTTTFITFLLGHAEMKASCTKEYVLLKQHVYWHNITLRTCFVSFVLVLQTTWVQWFNFYLKIHLQTKSKGCMSHRMLTLPHGSVTWINWRAAKNGAQVTWSNTKFSFQCKSIIQGVQNTSYLLHQVMTLP